MRCQRRLPRVDGSRCRLITGILPRGTCAANIGSKGQLHGAYEQEIGLECRKNDVASSSASVVQCRSAISSSCWFWRRRADARIPRPSTPMSTRHASGMDSPPEQTDLSPARCACKDHAEEQLISHNGQAHPARADLQRTHLIGRHSPADDVARSTCHRPLPKGHMRKIGLMAVPFDESRAAWLMSARG
jgi:hypothetical protein